MVHLGLNLRVRQRREPQGTDRGAEFLPHVDDAGDEAALPAADPGHARPEPGPALRRRRRDGRRARRLDRDAAILASRRARRAPPGAPRADPAGREFEILKNERLARLDQSRTDPSRLASNRLPRLLASYSPTTSATRRRSTRRSTASRRCGSTRSDRLPSNTSAPGMASSRWSATSSPPRSCRWSPGPSSRGRRERPYARIERRTRATEARARDDPDARQGQRHILAGLTLPMRDDHPDYPALILGNSVLGGGFSSRLADRLRQKGGLSYRRGVRLQRQRPRCRGPTLHLRHLQPGQHAQGRHRRRRGAEALGREGGDDRGARPRPERLPATTADVPLERRDVDPSARPAPPRGPDDALRRGTRSPRPAIDPEESPPPSASTSTRRGSRWWRPAT